MAQKWLFWTQRGVVVEAQSHILCLQSHLLCMHMHARMHPCAYVHARSACTLLAPKLANLVVLLQLRISACVHRVYTYVIPREINWWAGALCKLDPGPEDQRVSTQKVVILCMCAHSFLYILCMPFCEN